MLSYLCDKITPKPLKRRSNSKTSNLFLTDFDGTFANICLHKNKDLDRDKTTYNEDLINHLKTLLDSGETVAFVSSGGMPIFIKRQLESIPEEYLTPIEKDVLDVLSRSRLYIGVGKLVNEQGSIWDKSKTMFKRPVKEAREIRGGVEEAIPLIRLINKHPGHVHLFGNDALDQGAIKQLEEATSEKTHTFTLVDASMKGEQEFVDQDRLKNYGLNGYKLSFAKRVPFEQYKKEHDKKQEHTAKLREQGKQQTSHCCHF